MSLTKTDLLYDFPDRLVATKPHYPPRVLYKDHHESPKEIAFNSVFDIFEPGDVLILNTTKVLPRRVFIKDLDILFLETRDGLDWTVLFQAKKFKAGDKIELPEGVVLTLLEKGLPQRITSNKILQDSYFEKFGYFALPPYIQAARQSSAPLAEDQIWYQTVWAKNPGSLAAPTASLHFKEKDLEVLKSKVEVLDVTLHVGLGTFLPISSEDLEQHKMHKEFVQIPLHTVERIQFALENKKRVWCLGTTSLRSVEAWARGHLEFQNQSYCGTTDLFLKPGDEFKVCSGLLTNFHQPGSTLIALVAAFSSLSDVKKTYHFAIENNFRLFSYGDLSVWKRKIP